MTIAPPLTERARGRWGSILNALGIDKSFLSGRHGPCLFCGGRDRWRWINREGSGDWICSQCGHGSGMDLALRFLKCEFKEAAPQIEKALGTARLDRVPPKRDDARLMLAMRQLWRRTQPIEGAGCAYLKARGLCAPQENVRFLASYPYSDPKLGHFPTLVAKVSDVTGGGVNLHRTWLAPDGTGKAVVEKPRQLMRGRFPAGAAIRLFPAGSCLGIAEGIETAIAAHVLHDIPVWSVVATSGIERFIVPDGVEELVIFADNDANFAGQRAAYVLANRVSVQDKIKARVMVPEIAGTDWNDVLRETA